ncbi:MAG TPA: ATP-binding protein [Acidimicrobiales bacterium]|jgi:signal transduction histidine kinase|nr:ATP-binding protein [Acidimicrobiales bacterium]
MRNWWSNALLRTKGFVVLSIPLAALISVTVPGIIFSAQINNYVAANRTIKTATTDMSTKLALLTAAESGMRGYAATLDPTFLTPFHTALRQLVPVLKEPNTRDLLTSGQGQELKSLGVAEVRALGSIAAGVSDHSLSPDALKAALLHEQGLMAEISRVIGGALDRDTVRLATLSGHITSARAITSALYTYGLVVGVLGGALAMLLFLTGIVRRLRNVGRNAERLGEELPLLPFPPAGDELGRLDRDLRRTSLLLAERRQEIVSARDQAIMATKAKDTFVSRMSHELKTPLSAVVGFGELLQERSLQVEDAKSVNHIVKAGYHLLDLINDILDLSLVQAGQLRVSVEPLLAAEVVADAVSLVAPLAAKRQLTVTVNGMDGLVVAADRKRLHQVLLNLLSNAIKYNREGGDIVIAAVPSGASTIRFTVTDSGAGIPPNSMHRLFLPFERLQAEAQRISGTGVGLSLSRHLAEAMGGTMGAESELSVGSCFWVELPLAGLSDPVATYLAPLRHAPESAGSESESGSASASASDTVVPVQGPVAELVGVGPLARPGRNGSHAG